MHREPWEQCRLIVTPRHVYGQWALGAMSTKCSTETPLRTVSLGNVVDELHDKHSLPHSCSAEQPDLASTLVGGEQIHHLGKGERECST